MKWQKLLPYHSDSVSLGGAGRVEDAQTAEQSNGRTYVQAGQTHK
jgi:hypothetical protein